MKTDAQEKRPGAELVRINGWSPNLFLKDRKSQPENGIVTAHHWTKLECQAVGLCEWRHYDKALLAVNIQRSKIVLDGAIQLKLLM
jgi:hypothetical protein